ncbi:MAG: complex I subunit 5 family protein [Campylobacterales bacterium]
MSLLPWLALGPMLLGVGAFVFQGYGRHFYAAAIAAVSALTALTLGAAQTGTVHALGHLAAPLGIALRLDMFGWSMLTLNLTVFALTGLYTAFWKQQADRRHFWPLALFLWGSLNALYLSGDLFNLYVTLELITLSCVALIAVEGSPRALGAALGYLFAAWVASLFYLLGVGLTFAHGGVLDLTLLRTAWSADAIAYLALALMAGALMLKSALFPLHFWLPSAHAAAMTPVSALLSAAAIKGPFYLFFRLQESLEPHALFGAIAGILGAAAIVFGGILAWRSTRIKTLIAYSTVSQAGYFFLIFPLWSVGALQGGLMLIFSHALAKATLFLAAGNLILVSQSHRLGNLHGTARAAPKTVFGAALAAVSLAGLPPAAGFAGKWLMLQSALEAGAWHYAAVLIAGGLLAMGYLFKLLSHTLGQSAATAQNLPPVLEWTVLSGGLLCLLGGFFAPELTGWVRLGFEAAGVHLAGWSP